MQFCEGGFLHYKQWMSPRRYARMIRRIKKQFNNELAQLQRWPEMDLYYSEVGAVRSEYRRRVRRRGKQH